MAVRATVGSCALRPSPCTCVGGVGRAQLSATQRNGVQCGRQMRWSLVQCRTRACAFTVGVSTFEFTMSACPRLSLPSEGSFDRVSEKRKGHHFGVVCVCASTNIKRVASSTSCVWSLASASPCPRSLCGCVNVWCVFLCHVICVFGCAPVCLPSQRAPVLE